jgi:HD-GYP domain-containing protein (c-di-GMP phosphodiesterase class II)
VRRIRLEEAAAGQKVARTLWFPNGTVMVAAGATLTEATLQRLSQFGYRDISVVEPGAEDVDGRDLVGEAARVAMVRRLGDFFKRLRETVGRAAGLGSAEDAASVADALGAPEVRKQVKALKFPEAVAGPETDAFFDAIASERDAAMVAPISRTEATHHAEHAAAVAARSVMIARKLGWAPRELRELCLGALLHDVGYHVLPEEIARNDVGQQLHPIAGYHLLRADTGLSLLAAHCAYQHHERFDGRGWPRRLIGLPKLAATESTGPGYIHRYASVVAVADACDLMHTGFPDGWAMRHDEAIGVVRAQSGKAFHPEAAHALLAHVPPFPVGTEVTVNAGPHAGCSGIVASVSAAAIDRPVLRLLWRGGVPLSQALACDTAQDGCEFKVKGAD